MDPAATDSLIGQRIFGGYVVTGKIGAGGMGAVYLAENRDLGRKLGVKVLLAERLHSTQAVARFFAEAKAASAIRHRNIIDVLDAATLPDGRHYILMEYLEGSTLRAFARKHFPLTLEILLSVLGQVCAGLQAAHNRGIIHRDLKPSNIFVAPEPDNPYLTKILDFGIAKLSAPDLESDAHTKSRTVAGTPYYMSPEQARALRDVDHRTDLYAVGIIAYEMITGRPPYMANSAGDLVYQQQTKAPIPPMDICTELPPAWNQLILDTIALDPDRRPPTAKALAERMIAATDRGTAIARAAAPLLFTASGSPSEPISGESSRPLAAPNWSRSSTPEGSPESDPHSAQPSSLPPARPPRTAAAPPRGPARPPRTAAPASPMPSSAGSSIPSLHSFHTASSDPLPSQQSSHPSQTSSETSIAPAATRDLRSGSGSISGHEVTDDSLTRVAGPSRPPTGSVPTTLGMTASGDIPVYESTQFSDPGSASKRVWLAALAGVATLAGAAALMYVLGVIPGRVGQPDNRVPAAAPAPVVEPMETVEPKGPTEDTGDVEGDDEGQEAAGAAADADEPDSHDTGAEATGEGDTGAGEDEATEEPDDRAQSARNSDRRANRASGSSRPKARAGKTPDAGITDDDLFDSRK